MPQVNGSACSQNSYLINEILKNELGFQGFVVSDWLAQISGVSSALSGLDMSMPGDGAIPLFGDSYWMYELTRSVLNGSVPVARLNDMVTRVMAAWYQMGQDNDYPPPNFSANTADATGPLYPGALISPSGVVNQFVNVQGNHAVVAREIAQDAITLLKNINNSLPFTNGSRISVFGTDARNNSGGLNSCSDQGCDNGVLGMGWGSGSAKYPYLDTPIDAIRRRSPNVTFYDTDSFPSLSQTPTTDEIAIVFINSDSGENYITVDSNPGDRTTAGLNAWHNGDKLVQDAAAKYSTVIVVIHTVGPILLEAWHDLPSVKAVLVAHLPGQEAGDSLTAVLFGDVSPSGHLPYTIPHNESEYPASVGLIYGALGQPQDTYTEGLYIDYRYFNKQNVTPRYAFGHGLSYTTFNLSSAEISAANPLSATPPASSTDRSTPQTAYNTTIPPASEAYYPDNFNAIWRYLYSWLSKSEADAAAAGASTSTYPYPTGYSTTQKAPAPASGGPGGNPALWDIAYNISITVTNSGSRPGKAVVQLYLSYPDGIAYDTPVIQLRDFAKTADLQPGASQTLTMELTRKDMSVWDVVQQNWVVPNVGGRYGVWLGEASDALRTVCWTDTGICESSTAGPL